MNSSPTIQRVNPLIPESVGALLAEEWTIDPHSTLPSFLEMLMMEEAQRSAWHTLKSIMSYLQDRLDLWSQQSLSSGGEPSFGGRLYAILRAPHALRFISEKILAPYGPEIRFFLVYLLERKSLLSSSSATIAEVLHGGRRVKLCSTPTTHHADESNEQGSARQAKLLPMNRQDGIRLAMLVALGRYLMERGDWLHRKLSDDHRFPGLSLRLQKMFKFLYPFLFSTAKGLNLLQKWRYLLGESVFFDSYSRWLNLVVRRVVADDSLAAIEVSTTSDSTSAPKAPDVPRIFWQSTLGSPRTKKIALGLLTSAVGVSWIARLQLRRQQLRLRRQLIDDPKGAPSPQKALPRHGDRSGEVSCPPTHCPLCQKPRINATASTSGYVFCLACLTMALRSSAVCPITGKDCPESKITRLFEPHSL
jgi:hypothetical protein